MPPFLPLGVGDVGQRRFGGGRCRRSSPSPQPRRDATPRRTMSASGAASLCMRDPSAWRSHGGELLRSERGRVIGSPSGRARPAARRRARLKASTVSSSARPGKSMYHHARVEDRGRVGDHLRPSSPSGGWTPTPRNDSAASKQDVRRDEQRGVDDDRRDEVGQDLAEDDPPVRGAERARGLDELLLAQRQHLAADDARDVRPVDDARSRRSRRSRPGLISPPRQPLPSEHADAMPSASSRIGNASTTSMTRESSVSTQPR